MLATASLLAPSCCLRCQLLQIISRTTPLARPRCFASLKEDAGEEQDTFLKSTKSNDGKKEMYRRQYPLGRIVGQPGRRQRERSETLPTPSMRRPFDVVLLQDVKIREESSIPDSQREDANSKDNDKRTAGGIIPLDQQATQEEVNASIEELRPSTHILDRRAYDELLGQMLRSYNRNQLSSYMKKFTSISPPTTSNATDPARKDSSAASHVKRSDWRAGHTPLAIRHVIKQKQSEAKNGRGRKEIVHAIIRTAWNLTVELDETQEGELEMLLKPWQLSYLFGMNRNKRPNYEHLIQSPILLRNSKIERHEVDDTVRLTARRPVAEEIASLLETKLLGIGSLDLDLSIFTPVLRTPGWPVKLNGLFSRSDLEYVGQQTRCVIERGDDKSLHIHGQSETERHDAKRLLLSLLPLPSAISISEINLTEEKVGKVNTAAFDGMQPIPAANTANLPLRYRAKRLLSVARPTTKLAGPEVNSSGALGMARHGSYETRVLEELNRIQIPPVVLPREPEPEQVGETGTYWTAPGDENTSTWEVQLCRILQSHHKDDHGRAARKFSQVKTTRDPSWDRSIVHSHIPGINTLLSYFSPKGPEFAFGEPAPTPPVLIAYFSPSPFTDRGLAGMRTLPRLEMRYNLYKRHNRDLAIRHSSMRTIITEQDLRIPVPDESADLRFVRRMSLDAKMNYVLQNGEIQSFTRRLQQSLSTKTGALVGKPAIKIKLPALLVANEGQDGSSLTPRDDVEVQYLFERFEQIQTADLAPPQASEVVDTLDEGVRKIFEEMGETTMLQLRAIEGGIIGGSRTELALVVGETAHQDGGQEWMQHTHESLVKTSLALVRCLTRINGGQLLPLRVPSKRKKVL